MGVIRECATGQTCQLEPEHLVGRAPNCALRMPDRFVSARHAILRWTGTQWELKDLGSRNGTFVDGSRIKPVEECVMRKGSTIAFGKADRRWELLDDSGPAVMAIPIEGGPPVLLDGKLIALPSSDKPLATIFADPEGGWLLEQPDDSIAQITHLQTFEVGGQTWRFCCPERVFHTSVDEDLVEAEVQTLELSFSVSLDEKHVEVHATSGNRNFDLGARAYHFTLLTLARRRLDDTAAGLPETSCGWMYQEDVLRSRGATAADLNLDVFRIRKQLASVGIGDAAAVVERRPRTRQLRIGTGRLSIVTL